MTIQINRDNLNKVVDRTDVLAETPYVADITEALGLFQETYSTQKLIEITRTTGGTHILGDKNWDERSQNMAGRERERMTLKIPHFPADDAIYPHDIDGVISTVTPWEAMNLASVAEVRAEKMVNLQNAHQLTKTAARFQLLKEGTVYAPNGSMRTSYGDTVNYYTEFGVTRDSIALSLAGTADPRGQVRELVAKVRLDARHASGAVRGIVALCGSEFFSALIMNPFVTDAVKYVALPNNQSLATLLGVNADEGRFSSIDGQYPSITLWGITWVDCGVAGYDSPTGSFVPFVDTDEAIVLPLGLTNLAKTYYAPANLFSAINKRSQGAYWFETASDRKIEIQTEQNFMNALLYPACVKTLTLA